MKILLGVEDMFQKVLEKANYVSGVGYVATFKYKLFGITLFSRDQINR